MINNLTSIMEQVKDMTKEQFISNAHNLTAKPSLIILFSASMLLLLIIGLIATKNRKKFLLELFLPVFIIIGILTLIMMFMPEFAQAIMGWF